jgi:ubiquinone/menaquinone biosynthesis C-methylase UbiE
MDNKETKLTKKVYSDKVNSEWKRLVKDPFRKLEFFTTLSFLKEYLPKKGLVLDAGGGPGRYTIELAKLGYNVVLFDLVAECLEFARKQIKKEKVADKVKDIVQGSITDLSKFADNSFDAVLCLGGPLSHVHPEVERQKAISELVRVAKAGAPIFVSVMSKYGVMLATPAGWPQEVGFKKCYQNLVKNGEDYKWWGSGYCHYFTSDELEKMFLEANTDIIKKVGLEGLNVDDKTTNRFAKKFPEDWKNWLEIHRQICTDPFVVNASGHMMIIVRKNQNSLSSETGSAR